MGGGDEPQEVKKAAAAAYDYEKDDRWAEYWANVLIPPSLASRPDVQHHFRFKFYQRFIDADLQVDSLSSITGSRPSKEASTSSGAEQRSSSSNEQNRSTRGGSRSSNPPNSSSRQSTLDRHSYQFLENAWVVVMGLLAMIPFLPVSLGDRAYRYAFLGMAIACGHSIYIQYGKPRSWTVAAVQYWLQSMLAGKDLLYLLYSFLFISTSVPIRFALIPVFCQSLEFVARYLRRNFHNAQLYRKYLEKPCLWLETNNATLRMLGTNSEVILGFLLIFLLVTPQRSFFLIGVYWQLLKFMYHAPATASYHRNTWSRIGMRVNPLLHRHLPFVQGPLGFIQRWFCN